MLLDLFEKVDTIPSSVDSWIVAQNKRSIEAIARQWQLGRRLSRDDTNEQGTVVETGRSIKVKWDGGGTSYFRLLPANVRVIQLIK